MVGAGAGHGGLPGGEGVGDGEGEGPRRGWEGTTVLHRAQGRLRQHHHHHLQKDPGATAPADHHLKEESEEEQRVAWDLHLADFVLQRDIILIQWTTFMRQL